MHCLSVALGSSTQISCTHSPGIKHELIRFGAQFSAMTFYIQKDKSQFLPIDITFCCISPLPSVQLSKGDKTRRLSAAGFWTGDCYFHTLTRCWLYASSELLCWAGAPKIPISQKNINKQITRLASKYYCNLNLSPTVLSACVAHWTVPPSHSSSLFLYRNTKLIKVRHPEIHQMFLKFWNMSNCVSYESSCRLFGMYCATLLCCQ